MTAVACAAGPRRLPRPLMDGPRALGDSWPLSAREVHLWYVVPEEVDDPALVARYHALMTTDEGAQQRRFYFERDRHRYLVTRALVRTVLSSYCGLPPASWRFEKNEWGRPSIAPSAGLPRLHFNLSHTDGMILCAVTEGRDVGVDVEDTGRRGETVAIADRYFSPSEVRALHALPAPEQRRRFFEYWTLKESYIKARGMGLAIPLEQFSFHLDDPGAVAISFDPRLADRPSAWQFRLFPPTARHQVALAVRRPDAEDLAIRIRRTVPLASSGPDERW